MGQYRRLGASLDYSRERFTMDDEYVRAVMTFFVSLWERGWIYRANRIVNWCPYHETAISDLEVEHVEEDDTLYRIVYPFADGEGALTIATVRPCTLLADTAVAVHPEDPRYADAVGREVIVPVVERRVPVVADARVEREFGTGALKVTPGHDPMDFEIGRDHGLETLTVIGPDGRMIAPGFEGLTQQEADERILAWLEERGRLEGREPYRHSVGTCERCHSRIEPLVSPQWWCRMIVDIGGGTTEVAVISLGGIVVSQSLRVGGDEMDEAIVNHIKKEYKLLVGQQTAEEIKLEIGSAFRLADEIQAEVRGRDMTMGIAPVTGIPLPFVTVGGSSMVANLVAIGVLEAIHARGRPDAFQ